MDRLVKLNEEEQYCMIRLDNGKTNAVSFQLAEEFNAALDRAEQAIISL